MKATYGESVTLPQWLEIMLKRMSAGDSAEDMVAAFAIFDEEGTGFINHAILKHCMQHFGPKLSDEELKNMTAVADPKKTGKIDYKEFVKAMLG